MVRYNEIIKNVKKRTESLREQLSDIVNMPVIVESLLYADDIFVTADFSNKMKKFAQIWFQEMPR